VVAEALNKTNLRANRITSTEVFETTGSVQFDGSGDALNVSSSDDFSFGTGDFTVEAWVLANAYSGSHQVISITDGTENWQFFRHSGGTLRWNSRGTGDGATVAYNADEDLEIGTWHHIAATRNDNTLRLFKNGILVGTFGGYTSDLTLSTSGPSIGIWDGDNSSEPWNGHISNVRVIKGKALYTTNFTPPTRELEVIPNTVLLACQHKTDATHEKTGKTITVNGNAVANELTPGLLTSVVKSGGSSAITGSVEFANNSSSSDTSTISYLSLPTSEDFNYGTGDFTMECWINRGEITNDDVIFGTSVAESSATAFWYFNSSGNLRFREGSNTYNSTDNGIAINSWNHIAVTRESGTLKIFVNGIVKLNQSGVTQTLGSSSQTFQIGRGNNAYANNSYAFKGFISNLRIIKGTALYTSDFIPPTRKLTKLPGTVLLCCQDNESVTTEVTGKTITANGDPTASNFTPSVGSDGSVEFAGPTTINTENYFYLPTGNTESRTLNVATQASSSARGVFMGGLDSAPTTAERDVIDYITIASSGNAVDFGNLTAVRRLGGACSSATRGISLGGFNSPVVKNEIEYITISSTGDAKDFGDLIATTRSNGGLANSTRGISFGGVTPSPAVNTINYITIASTGNAQDFGDLVSGSAQSYGTASPTRGVIGGGETPSLTNTIQYVTIATMGNALDFGDLSAPRSGIVAFSNSTRGCFAGGEESPGFVNTIDYVTISTTANSLNFGDLNNTNGLRLGGSASSPTRGIYASGGNDTPVSNTSYSLIHMVTINSTGDSIDFGDITVARYQIMNGTVSSGHGGLG